MQILTKESLDAAIKKCQDLSRYRIYLVTEHTNSHQDILDYLSKSDPETIRNEGGEQYVRFSNGSVIRMLSGSSSATGRISNLVLCVEKYFNDDKIADRLRVMEIGYHMKQGGIKNVK